MGCSILSFVELFYFAIMAICTRFQKRNDVVDISNENLTVESKVELLDCKVKEIKECLIRVQASLNDLQRRMKSTEDEIRNQRREETQNLIR